MLWNTDRRFFIIFWHFINQTTYQSRQYLSNQLMKKIAVRCSPSLFKMFYCVSCLEPKTITCPWWIRWIWWNWVSLFTSSSCSGLVLTLAPLFYVFPGKHTVHMLCVWPHISVIWGTDTAPANTQQGRQALQMCPLQGELQNLLWSEYKVKVYFVFVFIFFIGRIQT